MTQIAGSWGRALKQVESPARLELPPPPPPPPRWKKPCFCKGKAKRKVGFPGIGVPRLDTGGLARFSGPLECKGGSIGFKMSGFLGWLFFILG